MRMRRTADRQLRSGKWTGGGTGRGDRLAWFPGSRAIQIDGLYCHSPDQRDRVGQAGTIPSWFGV